MERVVLLGSTLICLLFFSFLLLLLLCVCFQFVHVIWHVRGGAHSVWKKLGALLQVWKSPCRGSQCKQHRRTHSHWSCWWRAPTSSLAWSTNAQLTWWVHQQGITQQTKKPKPTLNFDALVRLDGWAPPKPWVCKWDWPKIMFKKEESRYFL